MTIFSPPLPSLLIRRRDATCSEWKGASGIPFCPPSWKQLENGCGMLGRRQRGQEKVPAVERANGRAARPKLMPSKFSLILLYLGEGEGRKREGGVESPSPLLFPSLPSSSTIPSTRKPTDQWRFKKIFQNFSPILSLRPLGRPYPQFQSLPILPSPPLLLSSSFFAVAANFSRENGRKTKKFAMIYHRRLRRGAPTRRTRPWRTTASPAAAQPWRRRREKLVRS